MRCAGAWVSTCAGGGRAASERRVWAGAGGCGCTHRRPLPVSARYREASQPRWRCLGRGRRSEPRRWGTSQPASRWPQSRGPWPAAGAEPARPQVRLREPLPALAGRSPSGPDVLLSPTRGVHATGVSRASSPAVDSFSPGALVNVVLEWSLSLWSHSKPTRTRSCCNLLYAALPWGGVGLDGLRGPNCSVPWEYALLSVIPSIT